MPAAVELHCPTCGWPMKAGPLMYVATEVVERHCPKCRVDWQAILRPVAETPGMVVTQVDWVSR